MASISLKNVSVEFETGSGRTKSLRSKLLRSATGGQLSRDETGRLKVSALNDINLEVTSGERIGLMGRNGAGKSSLLRVISRIYQPLTGFAEIDGSLGTLIDLSLGMNPEATGRQNILLRGGLLGIPKATIVNRFDEVVEFSELGEFIEMPVRTYSSGMQLRLAFAVSTIFSPDIVVMDEWLSVGDEQFRDKAELRLRALVDSAHILVIASHSRELLENTCTRGLWLEKGRIVADGPIRKVTARYFGTSTN